jgi:hypothetical protein
MITNLPSLSTQAPWAINCEIPPLTLLSRHSLHSYYVIVAFLANKNTMTTRSSHNKSTQTCSHNNVIISSKSQQCSNTSTWKCAMGLFMVLMINNWTNQKICFISIASSNSNSKTRQKKSTKSLVWRTWQIVIHSIHGNRHSWRVTFWNESSIQIKKKKDKRKV